MKKIVFTLLTISTLSIFSQNIGINSSGVAADPSAALDVVSANKGLLIPRVALTAMNVAAPVTSPLTSLLVYNTVAAGTGTNSVIEGYYFWDGFKWVRLQTSNNTSADWNITGNAGTSPATNFIGTTDNQDFVLRTNSTEKMRVTNTGSVGIGVALPTAKFEINSGTGYPSLTVGNMGFVTPFHGLSVQGTGTNGNYSLLGDATNLYINRPTGGNMLFRYNNTLNHMAIGTNGNVSIGPAAANPSALLDVQSSNKGFLMPRIALLSNTDVSTIATPATGLQVYNTNYTSTLSIGICYFDGAKWLNVSTYLPSGSGYFVQNSAFTVPNNGSLVIIPFGSIIAPQSGIYSATIRTFAAPTGAVAGLPIDQTAFYYSVYVNGVFQETVEYYLYKTQIIATSSTLRYTANAGDVVTFGYQIVVGYTLDFTTSGYFPRNNVVIAKVQ